MQDAPKEVFILIKVPMVTYLAMIYITVPPGDVIDVLRARRYMDRELIVVQRLRQTEACLERRQQSQRTP